MARRRKNVKDWPRTSAVVLLALLIAATLFYVSSNQHTSGITVVSSAPKPAQLNASSLHTRFAYLSSQHTNLCASQSYISPLQNGNYIQGSCCSFMNLSHYVEQVNGLANYSDIQQVPPDPYNISVSLAKELLGYDQNITLSPSQQATYDMAVNMSVNHGPCCCKCWRWYAFEGQAKYLITQDNVNASQIAKIWDLEDGCGGL